MNIDRLIMLSGALFIFAISILIYSCNEMSKEVERAGGIRQIMIDAGKDMKQIKKEIEDD